MACLHLELTLVITKLETNVWNSVLSIGTKDERPTITGFPAHLSKHDDVDVMMMMIMIMIMNNQNKVNFMVRIRTKTCASVVYLFYPWKGL